jgi:hypothetical protein
MSIRGFFTAVQDYRLPHPQVPLRLVLTTHLALVKAFELLRTKPPTGFQLSNAKEDEITRQLHWILENRILRSNEIPGFDTRRIKNVIRAPEVSNYNNRHPAKKPDLVLFLLQRESLPVLHSQDGLFAECKPVDSRHPIGRHYCDGGIKRFVIGDYAWAMREGMLIAYVRGGNTITKDLVPELISQKRRISLGSSSAPTIVRGSTAVKCAEPLHTTSHRRSFSWPAPCGKACPIQIFHSWHDCS